MNHRGILFRLIFIAVVCMVIGFSFGYERGANDANKFIKERLK